MAAPVTPWIVRPRPNPGAVLRRLCFPYAGARGAVLASLSRRLARIAAAP